MTQNLYYCNLDGIVAEDQVDDLDRKLRSLCESPREYFVFEEREIVLFKEKEEHETEGKIPASELRFRCTNFDDTNPNKKWTIHFFSSPVGNERLEVFVRPVIEVDVDPLEETTKNNNPLNFF